MVFCAFFCKAGICIRRIDLAWEEIVRLLKVQLDKVIAQGVRSELVKLMAKDIYREFVRKLPHDFFIRIAKVKNYSLTLIK